MKQYIKHDEWSIIEEGFHKEYNKISESIFSIGNGRIGQRANFEESFSGESLQGSYIAGIYYPDKTRVGWWKNGYPKYFAKVLNSVNWIGIDIEIDGQQLDLNICETRNFKRELNMQNGYLKRTFVAILKDGKEIEVATLRFCSIVDDECGVIKYSVKPLNFDGKIKFTPYLDFGIKNEDSNYDEKFWEDIEKGHNNDSVSIKAKTKISDFHVCSGMRHEVYTYGQRLNPKVEFTEKKKSVSNIMEVQASKNQDVSLFKYVSLTTSLNHKISDLPDICQRKLAALVEKGFDKLLKEQSVAWKEKWKESDVIIDGDVAAQQGIRFNIFQLNQTYTGKDENLNIGPKGFTGEKYGGTTYWDTEGFCLPFYMSTRDQNVAKNLLIYRYKHLNKAIENAAKLGFNSGAALYPMVTMNGEECHNEWEITFEEIHRNGAIAYAIYDYVKYTGDKDYLQEYGLETLIGLSRFWEQRVNFSERKKKYVILGVTGPNEYENNVNNNWYTNFMASWTLKYTLEVLFEVQKINPDNYKNIVAKTNLEIESETKKWIDVIDNMYYPTDEGKNIFLQQDGFTDKEIVNADSLEDAERPINQHWSWDRILRSCFIKQADVLQGLYFFDDKYDQDTIKRNFDFYEPITLHESSLSPCVHSILASKIGYHDKAYDMYLQTARLDLDDYNNDTEDGCHITSMAGSWLSIVKGFGGMRVVNDVLRFDPFVPKQWKGYSFKICFRGALLDIKVNKEATEIINHSSKPIKVQLFEEEYTLHPDHKESVSFA